MRFWFRKLIVYSCRHLTPSPPLFTVIITLCNILFFFGIDLYLVALSSVTESLCPETNKSGKFRG